MCVLACVRVGQNIYTLHNRNMLRFASMQMSILCYVQPTRDVFFLCLSPTESSSPVHGIIILIKRFSDYSLAPV